MYSEQGSVLEGELVVVQGGGRTPALRVDPESRRLREEIRDRWLRAKKLRSGSVNTREAYERDIRSYFAWCDARGFDVFQVFAPDIEEYVDWLATVPPTGRAKPRTRSTLARMVTSVSSFYAYAAKHTHGRVTNPVDAVERPRPESTGAETLALSSDEIARLRNAARRKGARTYALVQLLLGTGLRVSEICTADTSDLTTDGEHNVLIVKRKGGKRARVSVPPAACRALDSYLAGRKGPLFLLDNGKPMNRRMVDWHLSQAAAEAGITKRVSPHTLRHTAATSSVKGGVDLRDLQMQLGHARSETTARYIHAAVEVNNPAARFLATLIEDDDNADRDSL